MSTPPVTISSEVKAVEKKAGVWLNPLHIAFIVVILCAVVACGYLLTTKEVAIANAKAEIATMAANQAHELSLAKDVQNTTLQFQNKEVQQALIAANAQLAAANAQLQSVNQQLQTKLAARKKTDATLTPTQLSQRWQALEPHATVTPTPAGYTVDTAGGLATVQDLEELPIDRQRIVNLTVQYNNDETTIANDAKALQSEKDAHASDNANNATKLDAANKKTDAVQADFNLYKKKVHRNYLRIGVACFIAGLTAGIVK